MDNVTMATPLKQPIVFEVEGFSVPPGQVPLLFSLVLINFLLVLLGNGLVLCAIVWDSALHRPMYVLVSHMAACDLLGGVAVLLGLMLHLLGQRRVAYGPALAQAVCVHTYGAALQTILAAMAYDRYVAVCEPLRYHSIMTAGRLASSCLLAWLVAALCIAVLFALHADTPLCASTIQHVYCSNRSILSLACAPTPVNDVYGLCMSWSLSTGTFLVISYSYARILQACVRQGRSNRGLFSRAYQTCASHLVVYVLYEVATVIINLSQRFPSASPNIKKFCSILFIIVPPAINPIIYGLVTKELRRSILKQLSPWAKKPPASK